MGTRLKTTIHLEFKMAAIHKAEVLLFFSISKPSISYVSYNKHLCSQCSIDFLRLGQEECGACLKPEGKSILRNK